MEARLEQLLQGNAGTATRLAELSNELKELQSQVKANSCDLEVLKSGLQQLKSTVEVETPQRIEGKASAPAASKIVLVNKGACRRP